ncbi:hypothetical protein [Streptomyces sp. NPDC031705]|uniref:hypothetical protein n=1 Tax=Streptomyces sp. NPDC031705 TaxID=3155729 RepID=UPI0033EFCB41
MPVRHGVDRDEAALGSGWAGPPEGLGGAGAVEQARVGELPYPGRSPVLAGRGIGNVTDPGAAPSRGRCYAWSAALGPRRFHATEADAITRVTAA